MDRWMTGRTAPIIGGLVAALLVTALVVAWQVNDTPGEDAASTSGGDAASDNGESGPPPAQPVPGEPGAEASPDGTVAPTPDQPGGQASAASPARSVPAPGTYTYRIEGQNEKQTREYSDAKPVDGGQRQTMTLGTAGSDRKGTTEQYLWSDNRVALTATIFPGPPDRPPRECKWQPEAEVLRLPIQPGQEWKTKSRCVSEDQNSRTTMDREESVRVMGRSSARVGNQDLPCITIERDTVTRTTGEFKGSVSTNQPPPPPTEMKTRTVSCFSVELLVPLREVTDFESNAAVGAQKFHSEVFLESPTPA